MAAKSRRVMRSRDGGSKRAGQAPHLPSDESHHQDHVRARDRLRHGEDVGEVLVRDPAMHGDDKRTHIGQHGWKAAETDRGNDGEMQCQRHEPRGRFHDRRAVENAMLSGNSASSTMCSGKRLKTIRTSANTARPITNGRRRCGRRSRSPVRDQKTGRGNSAEDMAEQWCLRIAKAKPVGRSRPFSGRSLVLAEGRPMPEAV